MLDKTLNTGEIDFLDPEFYADPARHELFADMRKSSPVSWHSSPKEGGYWVVARHADIKAISLDPGTYSSAHGISMIDDPTLGAMITTDPPRHASMRKSVVSYFSNKAFKPLEDWLRAECRQMIQSAIEQDEVEFVFDVAANLPLSMIGKLMQLNRTKSEEMLRLTDGMAKAAKEGNEASEAAAEAIKAFALSEAQIRRGSEAKDLISAMFSVDGREQTDEEFATMFSQIAFAATETTRSSLSQIVLLLAQKPELMQKITASDCNLDDAINEFLRCYPPVHWMRRTVTRDHIFAGQNIKAGDKILLLYASANFDEEVFDAPLEFDMARRPNPHLTFGIGQHLCLGFRLARLELKVFMEEFLAMVSRVDLLAEPAWDRQIQSALLEEVRVNLTGR